MHRFTTNPPCRQVPPRSAYRESTDLLAQIERHLRRTNTAPSRFGRDAVRDPRLVFDLRQGKQITFGREDVVLAHLKAVSHA